MVIGYGVLMVNGPAAVPAKRKGEELDLQVEYDLKRSFLFSTNLAKLVVIGNEIILQAVDGLQLHLHSIPSYLLQLFCQNFIS